MTATFNPLDLSGKRLLVTGAASGIGRATSVLLSKLGADLILLDANASGLDETKSRCKETDVLIEFDLKATPEIKDLLFDVAAAHGAVDGLTHVAGVPYISPLKSISENKYMDVLRINTIAGLELTKAFASKKVGGERKGAVVFVSSVYALVGSSANVGYAMSKAALHGITKSLAIELAAKQIRVNCVAPGFVKTEMMGNNESIFNKEHSELLEKMHPLGTGEAKDVANAIAFLMSDAAKWITGTVLSVDGGFTAQ